MEFGCANVDASNVQLRRMRSYASQADVSESTTWSPSFRPLAISIRFTELRAERHRHAAGACRRRIEPEQAHFGVRPGRTPAVRHTGHSAGVSISIVPSTHRSGRAPGGSVAVEIDVDLHRAVLHGRIDALDLAVDDAVARVDLDLLADLHVLGLRLGDAQLGRSTSGRATRARLAPAATCWPSSTGTCCSTPAMPARTCNASAWRWRKLERGLELIQARLSASICDAMLSCGIRDTLLSRSPGAPCDCSSTSMICCTGSSGSRLSRRRALLRFGFQARRFRIRFSPARVRAAGRAAGFQSVFLAALSDARP